MIIIIILIIIIIIDVMMFESTILLVLWTSIDNLLVSDRSSFLLGIDGGDDSDDQDVRVAMYGV